jgi:hypothetical protein
MISYLAIIAFGAKQAKCLSIPKNIPTDLCCGDAEDDRQRFVSYLINFVNMQLPETRASILPLCRIRCCLIA